MRARNNKENEKSLGIVVDKSREQGQVSSTQPASVLNRKVFFLLFLFVIFGFVFSLTGHTEGRYDRLREESDKSSTGPQSLPSDLNPSSGSTTEEPTFDATRTNPETTTNDLDSGTTNLPSTSQSGDSTSEPMAERNIASAVVITGQPHRFIYKDSQFQHLVRSLPRGPVDVFIVLLEDLGPQYWSWYKWEDRRPPYDTSAASDGDIIAYYKGAGASSVKIERLGKEAINKAHEVMTKHFDSANQNWVKLFRENLNQFDLNVHMREMLYARHYGYSVAKKHHKDESYGVFVMLREDTILTKVIPEINAKASSKEKWAILEKFCDAEGVPDKIFAGSEAAIDVMHGDGSHEGFVQDVIKFWSEDSHESHIHALDSELYHTDKLYERVMEHHGVHVTHIDFGRKEAAYLVVNRKVKNPTGISFLNDRDTCQDFHLCIPNRLLQCHAHVTNICDCEDLSSAACQSSANKRTNCGNLEIEEKIIDDEKRTAVIITGQGHRYIYKDSNMQHLFNGLPEGKIYVFIVLQEDMGAQFWTWYSVPNAPTVEPPYSTKAERDDEIRDYYLKRGAHFVQIVHMSKADVDKEQSLHEEQYFDEGSAWVAKFRKELERIKVLHNRQMMFGRNFGMNLAKQKIRSDLARTGRVLEAKTAEGHPEYYSLYFVIREDNIFHSPLDFNSHYQKMKKFDKWAVLDADCYWDGKPDKIFAGNQIGMDTMHGDGSYKSFVNDILKFWAEDSATPGGRTNFHNPSTQIYHTEKLYERLLKTKGIHTEHIKFKRTEGRYIETPKTIDGDPCKEATLCTPVRYFKCSEKHLNCDCARLNTEGCNWQRATTCKSHTPNLPEWTNPRNIPYWKNRNEGVDK